MPYVQKIFPFQTTRAWLDAFDAVPQVAESILEELEANQKTDRHLKSAGDLISANDLWIASRAITSAQSLVTRYENEFKRVPDLRLSTY